MALYEYGIDAVNFVSQLDETARKFAVRTAGGWRVHSADLTPPYCTMLWEREVAGSEGEAEAESKPARAPSSSEPESEPDSKTRAPARSRATSAKGSNW